MKYSQVLDRLRKVSHITRHPGCSSSLDLCEDGLISAKRVFVGSGVIRIREHVSSLLRARITALEVISGNRFVLVVGLETPA